MTHFDIRLKEGMKDTLYYKNKFYIWVTPGLPIEVKFLTGSSNITSIYVSKNFGVFDSKYTLGVIVNEGKHIFIEELDSNFSNLEELQEKHPHLFEVSGTLYTFP